MMELKGLGEITDIINKNKDKALSAVVIIIALIIAANIYKGQVKLMESIKSQKEIEIKRNDALTEISSLQKKMNSYKDNLGKKDANSIINTINKIAQEVGVSIDSIRPQDEVGDSTYTQYSFRLILKAESYHLIGKFISRIESDPAVYIVGDIKIRSKAAAGGSFSAGDTSKASGLSVELLISTISLKG